MLGITIHERVPFSTSTGRQFVFFSRRRVARDSAGKQRPVVKRLAAKQRMVAKHMVAKHRPRKAQGSLGVMRMPVDTLICWSKSTQFLGTRSLTTHLSSFKKSVG